MFCFTIDGQDMKFHEGSKALLKALAKAFGKQFWSHLSIVYTRWGSSEEKKTARQDQNLTEEQRTHDIRSLIAEACPDSKG